MILPELEFPCGLQDAQVAKSREKLVVRKHGCIDRSGAACDQDILGWQREARPVKGPWRKNGVRVEFLTV